MTSTDGAAFAERIDTIEEAYEFMLAYAARGRTHDDESDPEGDVRSYLKRAWAALDGLAEAADARAAALGLDAAPWRTYRDMLADDARRAHAAIGFVLAQRAIGSQLIDNLNASLHLRTLLTDLFLVDSAFDAAIVK